MASNNITKQEALADLWALAQREPALTSRIQSKLESDFGVGVDEYIAYQDSMFRAANIDILEKRAEELEDIPTHSQIESMSDDEILRVYQARDELNAKLDDIGEPPTDAEWYKVGLNAEEKIERVRPFYEDVMAQEWERLEYPVDILAPFMGPIGAVTELVAGATDWRYDFKEKLHERGFGTSWNPLTGFGAWDIAEFKTDPETGRQGFSPELLQMEEELEQLYGTRNRYDELMLEGGYRDIGNIKEELGSLNQIINENQLLDPRMLGEIQ